MNGGYQLTWRAIADPNRVVRLVITFGLLLLLLYLRIEQRETHEFWIDETHHIRNLLPIGHLLFEHLPNEPGGFSGHHVLIAPIQYILSNNKFALGFPGLIAHICVFLFIPRLFLAMNLTKPGGTFWIATIARAGFVINTTLAYQSMEVRPYSVLPLLWMSSVFLATTTVRFLYSQSSDNLGAAGRFRAIGFVVAHASICVWHLYGVIMLASIYLFIALTSWQRLLRVARRPLTISMLIATCVLVFPVWLFYSRGSLAWGENTFAQIPATAQGMARGILGNLAGIPGFGFGAVVVILALLGLGISLLQGLNKGNRPALDNFWRLLWLYVVLVGVPIATILAIDIATKYWFIQRQFIWTTLPFWMGIGVSTSIVLRAGLELFQRVRR